MAGSRDWVPVLRGWVSFPAAAHKLDMTRQRMFQMLDEGKLTSVRRVPGAGDRPAAYLISDREMERLLAEQAAAKEAAQRAEAEALATAS
jgi:hypothetical protein